MKERRKMIEHTRNTVVPEIVNQKCREAYDMIYRECEQKNQNKNFFEKTSEQYGNINEVVYRNCEHDKKKSGFAFRKALAVAACAVLVSAGLIVPAAAKYAPSLKSAFSFVSRDVYSKDPAEKNDVTKFAEKADVCMENELADVTLQSIFCDGQNLSLALALTPNDYELFIDTTNIYAKYEVSVDGVPRPPKNENDRQECCFYRSDDGNYYTVIYYEKLSINAERQLDLKISELHGENFYLQHGYFDENNDIICYDPEKTIEINAVYDFEQTVKPDTSHNKIYEVNETRGNVTLTKVMVTPFMTAVYMSGLDDYNQYFELYDQEGKNIKWLNAAESHYEFTAPFVTSKDLVLEIHRRDQDDYPTEYTFVIPIEEGFVNEYAADNGCGVFDGSKIVYDPPEEELIREAGKDNLKKYEKMRDTAKSEPAGTTVQVRYDFGEGYDLTITGYDVADINDYKFSVREEACERYEKKYGSLDSAVLMLITCDIENVSENPSELGLSGLNLISKIMTDERVFMSGYEAFDGFDYASEKDNFGDHSYHYNFEGHEKRTITFGYVVPDFCEEAGYWAIFDAPGSDPTNFCAYDDVMNGEQILCEIK